MFGKMSFDSCMKSWVYLSISTANSQYSFFGKDSPISGLGSKNAQHRMRQIFTEYDEIRQSIRHSNLEFNAVKLPELRYMRASWRAAQLIHK